MFRVGTSTVGGTDVVGGSLIVPVNVDLQRAFERDIARPLGSINEVAITQAVERDIARTITPLSVIGVVLERAIERNVARPVTPTLPIPDSVEFPYERTVLPLGSFQTALGESEWGPGSPLVLSAGTLIHEFIGPNGHRRWLPDLRRPGGARVGQFQDEVDIAGGYISATGVIPQEEVVSFPNIYKQGATWKVFDHHTGRCVFAGVLHDLEGEAGQMVLAADGWGKRADREIERVLLMSSSLDDWAMGDQEPIFYGSRRKIRKVGAVKTEVGLPTSRIQVKVQGQSLRFKIPDGTSFPVNPDNWSGAFKWVPRVPLRFVDFDVEYDPEPGPLYTLDLVNAQGPDGALTVIKSWPLGSNVTGVIAVSAGGVNTVQYDLDQAHGLHVGDEITVMRTKTSGGFSGWDYDGLITAVPDPNSVQVEMVSLPSDDWDHGGKLGPTHLAHRLDGGAVKSYQQTVLADKPVSFWRMNEASGNLTDAMHRHPMVPHGTPTQGAPGIIPTSADSAFRLSGDDYADVQYNAGLNPNGPFSLELWVKFSGGMGQIQAIQDSSFLTQTGFALQKDANDAFSWRAGWGGTGGASGGRAVVGEVYHLVGTFDPANHVSRLYINAVKHEANPPNFTRNTTLDFTIGSNAVHAQGLVGTVQGVAFYDYALTAAQVSDHYDAGAKGDVGNGLARDLMGFRVSRSALTKNIVPGRTFIVRNPLVGGVATTVDYSIQDAFQYLFDRMGVASRHVAASTIPVVPYDSSRQTLGQVADQLAVFGPWSWGIYADADGKPRGVAGPYHQRIWRVDDEHTPVLLIGQERYRRVRFEYSYGGGFTAEKTVTCQPDLWAGTGYESTYALTVEKPANEDVMTVFAQQVANLLSQRSRTGSATLYQVVDPDTGATHGSSVILPGDGIRFPKQDNVLLTVSKVVHSEEGHLSQVEFVEGYPVLEKWLARQQREMNLGRGPADAIFEALHINRPEVPGGVLIGIKEVDLRGGGRRFDGYLDWDEVTMDIDGDPTSIRAYHARCRPRHVVGSTPVSDAQGGGWTERSVHRKYDNDPNLNDVPTRIVFPGLTHPKDWKWEFQVRAEDDSGQMSVWTDPVVVNPLTFGPPKPFSATLYIDQHGQHVEWDVAPVVDTDDDADPMPDHRIAFFKIEMYKSTATFSDGAYVKVGTLHRTRAHSTVFRVPKPRTHYHYVRVASVDHYGNVSGWKESAHMLPFQPPQPPAHPLIYFDTLERHSRYHPLSATVRFDYRYPDNTFVGDFYDEDDISHFNIRMQGSANLTWSGKGDTIRSAQISAEDTSGTGDYRVRMGVARRGHYYRARYQAVDHAGRKSPWSNWSRGRRAQVPGGIV